MLNLDTIDPVWANAICGGRRRGHSWQRIADKLGVNRGSVYRFAKRYEMTDLDVRPQTSLLPAWRFELMHPFERRDLEQPGQEGMNNAEIAADNAARASAKAKAAFDTCGGALTPDTAVEWIEESVTVKPVPMANPAPEPFMKWRGADVEAAADRIIERNLDDPQIAWLIMICTCSLMASVSVVFYVIAGMPALW